MPSPPSDLLVVFDESHGETWTIEPALAMATDPRQPEYYSYSHLRDVLTELLGARVVRNTSAPITKGTLATASGLVIAHPASATTHPGVGGAPMFSASELEVIQEYVRDGGGLLLLNEHHSLHWGSNMNALLEPAGLAFNDDMVSINCSTASGEQQFTSFEMAPILNHPVTRHVNRITYLSGCSLSCSGEALTIFSGAGGEPLVATATLGHGRVCAVGDTDLFAIPYVRRLDNLQFFLSAMAWLISVHPPLVPPHSRDSLLPTRPSVFVSYARSDARAVAPVCRLLELAGCRPWIDTQDITPGENFEDAIRRAIASSDFFVFCLSRNSVGRRGFLQRELRQALDVAQGMLPGDIYVIPLRLEDCEPPELVRGLQWLDFFAPDGPQRLLRAIQVGLRRRGQPLPAD